MPVSMLRRHALLGYFAMAFGISWGGIACVLAVMGFNLAELQPMEIGLFFLAMLLGPSVSSLILTRLLEGRVGLGRLVSQLLCWRRDVRWYVVALLTAPLLLIAILLLMGTSVAPAFLPHFQWGLLGIGLIAGSFEEIGWTGFATPRLLVRQGIGAAGLRLGLLWSLWHGLVVFLFTFGTMGDGWIWSFIVVYLATLTPYRVLMTWVYANTESVLLAVLMHASYTGWLLVFFPATSPAQSLVWQSLFAVLLWVAAVLALIKDPVWVDASTPAPANRAIRPQIRSRR